jgi:hypothetical protein
MNQCNEISGGCHCGALTFRLETPRKPADFAPRACDCSYCLRHGAAWISDAEGALEIRATEPSAVGHYRQGANLADLVFCRACGTLVAVLFAQAGQTHGAVNARCANDRDHFAQAQTASPQFLSAEQKQDRWTRLWCHDVRLHGLS